MITKSLLWLKEHLALPTSETGRPQMFQLENPQSQPKYPLIPLPGFVPDIRVTSTGRKARNVAASNAKVSKEQGIEWEGCGSVFWCLLDREKTPDGLMGGKPVRPHILLGPDPFRRLLAGMTVGGVPLSSKEYGGDSFSVAVETPSRIGRAIPTHAITLHPDQVLRFVCFSSDKEEAAVSKLLSKQFEPVVAWQESEQNVGGPGAIITAYFKGGAQKRVVVVSSGHLENKLGIPVLTAPVDQIEMLDCQTIGNIGIQPILWQRLHRGKIEGRLCPEDTLRLQNAARSKFGLAPV